MPVSASDNAFVREVVLRRSAIVLDHSKDYLIESRLDQLVRDGGATSIGELISRARSGDEAVNVKIVEAITTHETSFFRDLHPFDALRRHLLPRLIDQRQQARALTIWSAACSSGQEAFSIAMMLLEHFPALATWSVRIIGTDISHQVLARAREGRFAQFDVNRGLPVTLLMKYFERSGTHWVIKPGVKQLVEFRHLNLIEGWTLAARPDIIFLRNVLIYFDVDTKRRILARLREVIPRDGVLFLGTAETTVNVADDWEAVVADKATYYRVRP
jgi:chemotaxis protein methyltransferase CheR